MARNGAPKSGKKRKVGKMARYIKFYGGTDYCGCDFEKLAMFDDDTLDGVIDSYSYELAQDNAEAFAYIATGWDEDDEGFESKQDEQNYYESCWWDWEEITKEEYERIQKEGF